MFKLSSYTGIEDLNNVFSFLLLKNTEMHSSDNEYIVPPGLTVQVSDNVILKVNNKQ